MRLLFLLALTPLLGCAADLCAPSDDPSILLGDGVGGAFVEYEDEQEVPLRSAPQGGFGVTVLVATFGLPAAEDTLADVQLDVRQGGELKGSFLSRNAPLRCRSAEEGGLITDVVVGFDGAQFPTLDDFIDLNGTVVDLEVGVITHDGPTAAIVKPVTIHVSR
jgi:hypothetical protein